MKFNGIFTRKVSTFPVVGKRVCCDTSMMQEHSSFCDHHPRNKDPEAYQKQQEEFLKPIIELMKEAREFYYQNCAEMGMGTVKPWEFLRAETQIFWMEEVKVEREKREKQIK